MSTAASVAPAPHGVLVVDKPPGMTSHDVVARVRRALHTRRVGHAGTLDPMATGVLVVLVGEATKLAPWLTAHDKRYRARVELGVGTESLDADGRETERAPLPATVAAALAVAAAPAFAGLGSEPGSPVAPTLRPITDALTAESQRREQVPPAVSAIHVDGRRAHERVRAGEVVELEPRPVAVHLLRALAGGLHAPLPAGPAAGWLDIELHVAKGYYVRALARDLGARLGVPAHLSMLRRIASGPFREDEAVPLGDGATMRARLVPVADAARRALPAAELTEAGTLRAIQGKLLGDDDFVAPLRGGPTAWISHRGALVAVGAHEVDGARVLRGFGPTDEKD